MTRYSGVEKKLLRAISKILWRDGCAALPFQGPNKDVRGSRKRCEGLKQRHGAGEVAWAGGPGSGSTRGLKKDVGGQKKRGPRDVLVRFVCEDGVRGWPVAYFFVGGLKAGVRLCHFLK